jgi:cytochrome c oxidase assembly factor 5
MRGQQAACGDVRQEFIDCILQYSECVRQPGTTFKDCVASHLLPEQCQPLRMKYFECRKALVDPRTRLRGNVKG